MTASLIQLLETYKPTSQSSAIAPSLRVDGRLLSVGVGLIVNPTDEMSACTCPVTA